MTKITFKNLESSELARDAAIERIEAVVEKFEHLKSSRIQVTLEMENSPTQAGPDLFKVKVQVNGGRYDGVRIDKSASSLYAALADVVDHMLETLNRFSDKVRVTERKKARRLRDDASNLDRSNT
jgi:ribosome-associated translation inhibitor RaiA